MRTWSLGTAGAGANGHATLALADYERLGGLTRVLSDHAPVEAVVE